MTDYYHRGWLCPVLVIFLRQLYLVLTLSPQQLQ